MKKKIKNIRIIVNPASGKEESILPIINVSMKEAGIMWEASITHKAGDAIRFAKAAVKEDIDALAVYGGDGTLMEAISGLIGSEIPFLFCPEGLPMSWPRNLAYPMILKKPARS
jgi:diacylglycerol kinase (ATP)